MNRFVYANPKLCIGCDTCLAACVAAHMAVGMSPQPRLFIARSGQISMPVTCRHCENAPCLQACPRQAISHGSSGIELDESKCDGCGLCVPACPFAVVRLAASGKAGEKENGGQLFAMPASQVAAKCDLCDFAGKGPECVRACPTDALFLIDAKRLRKDGSARRKASAQRLPPFASRLLK